VILIHAPRTESKATTIQLNSTARTCPFEHDGFALESLV